MIFKCPPPYQIDGSDFMTCVNSKWIGQPVCKGIRMGFEHGFILGSENINV